VVRLLDAGVLGLNEFAQMAAGADLSQLEAVWDKVLEETKEPERRRT
jgi:hypothetical protein